MKRSLRIALVATVVVGALATTLLYGLFHGYFDHGEFYLRQFQWSPEHHQVAMVAERFDHESLGGLEYYVLIRSRVLTPAELRRALYSNSVVFDSPRKSLTLHWNGPNRLVIGCKGTAITKDEIDVQRREIGSDTVSYENIAIK